MDDKNDSAFDRRSTLREVVRDFGYIFCMGVCLVTLMDGSERLHLTHEHDRMDCRVRAGRDCGSRTVPGDPSNATSVIIDGALFTAAGLYLKRRLAKIGEEGKKERDDHAF